MCHAIMHGHTDSKSILQYAFFEVPVQRWTFTISLPNFLFSDLFLCLYLYGLPEMQHALPLTIIYHAEKRNARNKIRKVVFLSKMPLGKGSAAVCFKICFKRNSFFLVVKGDCRLNTPRFEFWSMRNFSGVMFGKTGSQIFGNSGITMSFRCNIDQ